MIPASASWACAAALLLQTPAAEPVWKSHPEARQEYTSDYVSFVGSDEQGRVIFALDTNRGRDGKEFQAEHFAVMHDEGSGWVMLKGNGTYPNPQGKLDALPDSEHYQFSGSPAKGWTISSPSNALSMKLEALALRTSSEVGGEQFFTRSGAGTLTWKGRTLKGRAIHEWSYLIDDNLITDPSIGTFGDGWHAAYLWVEGGGDLRAHLSGGEIKKLLRKRSGFQVQAGATDGAPLESLRFEPGRWSQGRGFYRWPTRWNLDWGPKGSRSVARLELASRENIANWGVGAFGVAIVSGEIEHDGVKRSVYGLGQIVR